MSRRCDNRLEYCVHFIHMSGERMMNRIQRYVLGLVAVLALAGCASHHHHGMASEGKGDAS